jgi:succinate dehydrogenase / fumarate reductase iron-sulfur subunit
MQTQFQLTKDADSAFDAATCIGCGVVWLLVRTLQRCCLWRQKYPSTLCYLRRIEATDRVLNMVSQMDAEGFGNCTNTGACEVECPKGISENIARMNRVLASLKG